MASGLANLLEPRFGHLVVLLKHQVHALAAVDPAEGSYEGKKSLKLTGDGFGVGMFRFLILAQLKVKGGGCVMLR